MFLGRLHFLWSAALISYGLSLCAVEKRPSLLSVGIGIFDVDHRHPRAQFQLEYKPWVDFYNVRPLVGIFSTDRGSTYLYAGAGYDIFLGKKVVLTPSFAPGIYFRGKGKDLGFPLEFRSCIELAYIFENQGRLGAQFYHISNASLGHKNPGEESLIFFYSIPL